MKKFAEQLKKRSEKLRLSVYERDELRERLLSYMEYHPLPQGVQAMGGAANRNKKKASVFMNGWLVGRFAGVAAMMIFIVVPVMAEDALPGDTLYPIKVRFNEELRGALVSSPYQKVEWETERLELTVVASLLTLKRRWQKLLSNTVKRLVKALPPFELLTMTKRL